MSMGSWSTIGMSYGAGDMSDRQLLAAIKRANKAAEKFRDKNGVIGHNVAAEKLVAYKWELSRRNGGAKMH